MSSKTLIKISRRSAIIIAAVAIVSTLVAGSILSNYLVPSTVNVTSQPGITVYPFDSVSLACTNTPVTSFTIGDVQQTQQKTFASICIRNTGGQANAYVIQAITTSGVTISSMKTSPAVLPQGLTLTWNAAAVLPACGTGGTAGSTLNGNCILIGPGSQTPPIALTLSVDTSASVGTVTFTIEFDAYSTVSG